MNDFDLYIDSVRWAEQDEWERGILIRARLRNGDWVTTDIGVLEKDSLQALAAIAWR